MQFELVDFDNRYASQIPLLYHLAVHGYQGDFYNQAQLQAWSARPRSVYHWRARLNRSRCWLALIEDKCVGFINVETHYHTRGYVDSLYVLPQYQGLGIASALVAKMESWARAQGYIQLNVDASISSKPLFLRHGFSLHHKRYQQKRDQVIVGFAMVKQLESS
ncbi:GNAT family N-acetyltransferase [Shewanella waksmanii]|uniref:GNAT family N-acetyltransferase n=1 Tax=Shewanella waksmanii TaxID=213783 RepID=UPI003736BE1A